MLVCNYSQAQSSLSPESDSVYTEVHEMPTFPGGNEAFYKNVIAKKIHYPGQARRMGIQGTVMLSFIVEKDGTVTDIKVEESLSTETDAEAARVISESPKWNPGKLDGTPVRVRIKRPIKFKLAS